MESAALISHNDNHKATIWLGRQSPKPELIPDKRPFTCWEQQQDCQLPDREAQRVAPSPLAAAAAVAAAAAAAAAVVGRAVATEAAAPVALNSRKKTHHKLGEQLIRFSLLRNPTAEVNIATRMATTWMM